VTDPASIGLRRDRVAQVLERAEHVHGAVLDAVFVARDQAAADPAVVGVLARVVEQVRVAGTDIGRLMRFPCLRAGGVFFATCEHRTGDLIVTLPRHRVSQLSAAGDAQPFAPAGRTFKEWALIGRRDHDTW